MVERFDHEKRKVAFFWLNFRINRDKKKAANNNNKALRNFNDRNGFRIIGGLDQRVLLQLINYRNKKFNIEAKPKKLVKSVIN